MATRKRNAQQLEEARRNELSTDLGLQRSNVPLYVSQPTDKKSQLQYRFKTRGYRLSEVARMDSMTTLLLYRISQRQNQNLNQNAN